jgi:hypothetical protein
LGTSEWSKLSLGSGPIDLSAAILFRLCKETADQRCPTVFFSAVALAATVIFWL